MLNGAVTVNFDSECCVPPDLPHHGEVVCQVVRSHCQIIDCWNEWATFEVRLLLKQSIDSGCGPQSFTKEVTVRESVMLDPCVAVRSCRVSAAICRCVLNRGLLHCNGTVKVEFALSAKHGCGDPCHPSHCGIGEEWLHMGCCRDDWDNGKKHDDCWGWHDDWKKDCWGSDWSRDCGRDKKRRFCDDDRKHDDCCDRRRKFDCDDDWKRDCDCDDHGRKKHRRCHDDDFDDKCDRCDRCGKRHDDRKHCRCDDDDDHKRDRCDKKRDDHKFCRCDDDDDHKCDRCKFCGRPKKRSCRKHDHDCDRSGKSKRSYQQVIVHTDHGKNKRFIYG